MRSVQSPLGENRTSTLGLAPALAHKGVARGGRPTASGGGGVVAGWQDSARPKARAKNDVFIPSTSKRRIVHDEPSFQTLRKREAAPWTNGQQLHWWQPTGVT